MVEAPKPVQRTVQLPRGVPATQAEARSGNGAAAPTNVSVGTARPRTSQLRDARERIQIIGDSNAGKSYAYMRKAMHDHAQKSTARWFVIDTDDTMPPMLQEGGEFEGLFEGDGGNVYVYPCDSWGDIVGSLHTIMRTAHKGDWIVFDVVNQAYDLCVAVVAASYGLDVQAETFRRIQSREGFGAFPAEIWQAVSVLFDGAIRQVTASPANVIFVQHLTDYVEQRSTREVTLMFDQIGVKPQGAKKISKISNTVVFLWTVRKILKDNNKKRIGSEIVRKLTIVKDRGKLTFADVPYDKDFFDKLAEVRASGIASKNITDPDEAAAVVQSVMADIRATQSGAEETPASITVEAEGATEQ